MNFLFLYPVLIFSQGMEHHFLSSIPRFRIFAGYGAPLSLFHTPVQDFRRVWSTTFSLPYPGSGFLQGIEHDFLSSIPRFSFFAGYRARLSRFYTLTLDFHRVWSTIFSLLYPGLVSSQGIEHDFLSSIPRLGRSEIYSAGTHFYKRAINILISPSWCFCVCHNAS